MDKVIIRLDGKKIEVYGNNGEQLTDCASTIRIDKEKTMGTDDKTVVDRITISCIILRPFYPFEDIGDQMVEIIGIVKNVGDYYPVYDVVLPESEYDAQISPALQELEYKMVKITIELIDIKHAPTKDIENP